MTRVPVWIEATENPWGIPVLDVRPVTLAMLAGSEDPQCAVNAMSFVQDDGRSFIGEAPASGGVVKASLRFPIDRVLADGVLFAPRVMEEKWALFYHRGQVICVRSWLRRVQVVADVVHQENHIVITHVRGTFGAADEAPEFTVRILDYLLRSHALDAPYPAPLAAGLEPDPQAAAMWCFSMFGNRALFATAHVPERRDPDRPLRTYSLLQIATARADIALIDECLAAGVPIDLLAPDGLAPLHWAIASSDPMIPLAILDRGSPVDVRSIDGRAPLMTAVGLKRIEKVGLLLDRGADVNTQDQRGFTALHLASEMGEADIVRLLLDRGASLDLEAEGFTARALAAAHNQSAIVALLDQRADRAR